MNLYSLEILIDRDKSLHYVQTLFITKIYFMKFCAFFSNAKYKIQLYIPCYLIYSINNYSLLTSKDTYKLHWHNFENENDKL